jgi:acetyl-CoA carboxylase carboxyl transferase subunit alpha
MAAYYQMDFEKPVAEIEKQIEAAEAGLKLQMASVPAGQDPADSKDPTILGLLSEIDTLKSKHREMLTQLYSNLRPWDTVRIARHPQRPQTRDYINLITRDFTELHGDRRFGDDPAIVTGFCRIGPIKCLVVGHQKGKETAEKIACHFGCAHPEGYRKALLKMELAEKFGLPVVTFVDTPGAYPGLGAEQRGQAEAIAVNMLEMSRLKTPIVSIVIGEGGSGGALGIAVADRVAMLENSWYSVISPEGCAAILWKEANEQTNNAAAKAGHSFCVPTPAGPYFNMVPDAEKLVMKKGDTRTVKLTGYSDGAASSWSLKAIDYASLMSNGGLGGLGGSPILNLSLSQDSASPGQSVTLTVEVTGTVDPSNGAPIVIVSKSSSTAYYWPLLVTTQ